MQLSVDQFDVFFSLPFLGSVDSSAYISVASIDLAVYTVGFGAYIRF